MKKHFSFFLFVIFFSAFFVSATEYAKSHLYESFDKEEVFAFELEEEEEKDDDEREYLIGPDDDEPQTSHPDLGTNPQRYFSDFIFWGDQLLTSFSAAYEARANSLQQRTQQAASANYHLPYFILFRAFRADC
jgi:hypothetical protein